MKHLVAPPPPPPAPAPRYEPPPAARPAPAPAAVIESAPWWQGAYIAPSLLYAFPHCDDCIEEGFGWQVAIGKAVSEHLNVELAVTDREQDFEVGPRSLRQTDYGINLLYLPVRNKAISPFLLVGGGAHHTTLDLPNSHQTDPYATIGAGLLASPWDWDGAIRAGVQHFRPFESDSDIIEDGDTALLLGLQFPLGS